MKSLPNKHDIVNSSSGRTSVAVGRQNVAVGISDTLAIDHVIKNDLVKIICFLALFVCALPTGTSIPYSSCSWYGCVIIN